MTNSSTMARNNYNNFSGYQFSPRSQFMGDPLRNPYEMEFRTPHGFPPRPRESPAGFSPRHQFSSNRLKRPFPQNSADVSENMKEQFLQESNDSAS